MIPDEEVMDILILLWHGHLGLDQVEEEGGGHDGPAVDHGVVGLPVVVQHDLIEVPPTGFSANVLLYNISSQLVQADGIGEGFTWWSTVDFKCLLERNLPCRLDAELVMDISNIESLTINCAKTHSPLLWISSGQLWNVISRFARSILLAFHTLLLYLLWMIQNQE